MFSENNRRLVLLIVVFLTGAALLLGITYKRHRDERIAMVRDVDRRAALLIAQGGINNPDHLRQVMMIQMRLRKEQRLSPADFETLLKVIAAPPDYLVQAKAITTLLVSHRRDFLTDAQRRRVVDHLIPALKNPEMLVRHHACVLLGELGDQRAVAELVSLLNDPDVRVRTVARQALTALGYRPS